MIKRAGYLRAWLLGSALMSCAVSPALAQDGPFSDWSNDFQARMAQEGVSPEIISSMFDGLEPDMRIIERDRSQPEFVRPIWEYIQGAASDQRAENGRAAQMREIEKINQIEAGDVNEIAALADKDINGLSSAPLSRSTENFYLTNPIARASKVMNEMSAMKYAQQEKATGTK